MAYVPLYKLKLHFVFNELRSDIVRCYCILFIYFLLSVPERALICFRLSFLAAALWSPLNISLIISLIFEVPPYGSNWGHKIADFEFLPYISFIVAFIASECIKRYWESICGESK